MFEEIRSRLSGLSSDLAKAQAQMAQAERVLVNLKFSKFPGNWPQNPLTSI